jgi:hypothetical protein
MQKVEFHRFGQSLFDHKNGCCGVTTGSRRSSKKGLQEGTASGKRAAVEWCWWNWMTMAAVEGGAASMQLKCHAANRTATWKNPVIGRVWAGDNNTGRQRFNKARDCALCIARGVADVNEGHAAAERRRLDQVSPPSPGRRA